ncbi:MAG: hypothetical protein KAI73_10060 [Rhodospirillaceae bacterium]|nr:hypothetical protein [Rhodospirillaceae bacterium]
MLSIALFVLLLGGASLAGFIYLIEPGPEGRFQYLKTAGKLLLYKYEWVDTLTEGESKRLYRSSCSRRCHSRDVVERKSRTAAEWSQIVGRMGMPDRADLSEAEMTAVIEHLQRNYLSNVPTLLPDETMRFIKKHMWRMDFGESDLYFDIIYLPRRYRHLMPYLAYQSMPSNTGDALFVIYMNTHTGMVPPWNLGDFTTIKTDRNSEMKALDWEVLYEDGQLHHRQGILTFPGIEGEGGARESLEITIRPPGMRERAFYWRLPVPDMKLAAEVKKEEGNKE